MAKHSKKKNFKIRFCISDFQRKLLGAAIYIYIAITGGVFPKQTDPTVSKL